MYDQDDAPTVVQLRSERRKVKRRAAKCTECKQFIPVGEYRYIWVGKWDGEFQYASTCGRCRYGEE